VGSRFADRPVGAVPRSREPMDGAGELGGCVVQDGSMVLARFPRRGAHTRRRLLTQICTSAEMGPIIGPHTSAQTSAHLRSRVRGLSLPDPTRVGMRRHLIGCSYLFIACFAGPRRRSRRLFDKSPRPEGPRVLTTSYLNSTREGALDWRSSEGRRSSP
jgi:hypothetical protein